MKKVARLRAQDEQFLPPGGKINANAEQTGVRTTGRIKKPKAVFDPSDNYMPRSQRVSMPATATVSPKQIVVTTATTPPSASSSITSARRERSLSTGSNTSNTSTTQTEHDICIICLKREPRRGGNYRNRLIPCIDCNKRVHKLCLSVDFYESAPLRLSFKCDGCKACEVCNGHEIDSKTHSDMVTCVKCCKSYHLDCHIPKLSKFQQSQRNWKCTKCAPATPANVVASTKINNSYDNSNSKDETTMPVKVIRQIIGDDGNFSNSVLKPQQKQTNTYQQMQPAAKSLHQQEPKLQSQQQEQVEPCQLQEPVNIAKAAAEAGAKAEALRRKRDSSSNHLSNGANTSDENTSDDDNEEEFTYNEKKKVKTNLENDTKNGNGLSAAPDAVDVKPVVNATNHHVITDLPKRELVKNWSVDSVAQYISKYFPNEARVLKEQEIDGNALLLLKRSDIVKKLPLKLGPSLRLYNLILKIQTQTVDDPTLGWDCSADTCQQLSDLI